MLICLSSSPRLQLSPYEMGACHARFDHLGTGLDAYTEVVSMTWYNGLILGSTEFVSDREEDILSLLGCSREDPS